MNAAAEAEREDDADDQQQHHATAMVACEERGRLAAKEAVERLGAEVREEAEIASEVAGEKDDVGGLRQGSSL